MGKKGKTWKEIEKRKRKCKKCKNRQEKKKRGPNAVRRETAQKWIFLHKSFNRKSCGNRCTKRKILSTPRKKEQEEEKNKRNRERHRKMKENERK